MALEQIGQKLKSARETTGMTLGQIFDRTKIPINHLESIDNGLSDELPEPVYVAGYIKRYADCVGLNGQSLSDEYRRHAGGGNNGNNGNKSNGGGPAFTATRMVSQPVIMSAPPSFRHSSDMRAPNFLKQGLWYVFLLVIVLVIMSLMFTWQNNNSNNGADPSQLLPNSRRYNTVGNTMPNQVTQPAQPNQAVQPTAPAPLDSEAAVAVSASQHVWVEITSVSSGQTLYSGFMERGERKDYKDPQGVRVHAGDGARLTIESNGKSETLGAPGKVSEKVFMGKDASATTSPADAKATAAAAAAAAKAALLTAPKKPVVKKPVNGDGVVKRRPKAEDSSGGSNASAGSRSIDVPYRYTESHDGD